MRIAPKETCLASEVKVQERSRELFADRWFLADMDVRRVSANTRTYYCVVPSGDTRQPVVGRLQKAHRRAGDTDRCNYSTKTEFVTEGRPVVTHSLGHLSWTHIQFSSSSFSRVYTDRDKRAFPHPNPGSLVPSQVSAHTHYIYIAGVSRSTGPLERSTAGPELDCERICWAELPLYLGSCNIRIRCQGHFAFDSRFCHARHPMIGDRT